MSSAFVTRIEKDGSVRWRVRYRLGGRETQMKSGGTFKTLRDAKTRRDWITSELAAMRVPDLRLGEQGVKMPTLRDEAIRWRNSRVDVADGTVATYHVSLGRILPCLGNRHVNEITAADIAEFVNDLATDGLKRQSIRKTISVLGMVFDFCDISPNPARDRKIVRLPREDREEPQPPSAEDVEAVARLLSSGHRLALLWLDWSGARVGSVDSTLVSDYDKRRRRVRLRRKTQKTREPLWVELPDAIADALENSLGPREDRDPDARLFHACESSNALRTAIGKACKATGIALFSPHDLRHRRISLLHLRGVPWARIGAFVGQRNLAVTANVYSHVMLDEAEVDYAALLS
jgi:integrase